MSDLPKYDKGRLAFDTDAHDPKLYQRPPEAGLTTPTPKLAPQKHPQPAQGAAPQKLIPPAFYEKPSADVVGDLIDKHAADPKPIPTALDKAAKILADAGVQIPGELWGSQSESKRMLNNDEISQPLRDAIMRAGEALKKGYLKASPEVQRELAGILNIDGKRGFNDYEFAAVAAAADLEHTHFPKNDPTSPFVEWKHDGGRFQEQAQRIMQALHAREDLDGTEAVVMPPVAKPKAPGQQASGPHKNPVSR